MKYVSMFGGIGTKQSHYKHAIEVYKSNGYNVFFYENHIRDICVPKQYVKTSNLATKNDSSGTIIHCNSGGLWVGLDYLAKTNNNKLFICEAGPLECDTTNLVNVFEKLYNFKCPNIIRRNIDQICDKIGIPHSKNHEWMTKYKKDIENIQNLVCLTSKNDNIINSNYINDTITKKNNDNKKAKRYEFDTGTHWNISKTETQKYQDILQYQLDQISKS